MTISIERFLRTVRLVRIDWLSVHDHHYSDPVGRTQREMAGIGFGLPV